MKVAIILLAIAGVSFACESEESRERFESYRKQYRKFYPTEEEYNQRCDIFERNRALIEGHNIRYTRGAASYSLEINSFSDLTHDEFLKYHTGLQYIPDADDETRESSNRAIFTLDPNFKPDGLSADWNATGYVSPVKNQNKCGSCWSFATTAVVEAHYAIKYNGTAFLDLSEEMLLDCSTSKNKACDGGQMLFAYDDLIKNNQGLMLEKDYPYISGLGHVNTSCDYDDKKAVVKITGYYEVEKKDAALFQAVYQKGPVAVGINAIESFSQYKEGSFCPTLLFGGSSSCGSILLNHAVLLVGATPDDWIIKNSWGEGWGKAGFGNICRKQGNKNYDNNCGINKLASFPIIEKI